MARSTAPSAGNPSSTPKGQTPVASEIPDPLTVYKFLTGLGVSCLDPRKPFAFWRDAKFNEEPFSEAMVAALRGAFRQYLLDRRENVDEVSDKDHVERLRQKLFVGMPKGKAPLPEDLFQVAGSHCAPRLRLWLCVRMAGLNKTSIVDAVGASAQTLSKYFDGEVASFPQIKSLCKLLDLNEQWVEDGPRSARLLQDPPHPWWLSPWWLARQEAVQVLDRVERLRLLPWRRSEPLGYDFAAFWSSWQQHPEQVPLPTQHPEVQKGGEVHFRNSLLPWIFMNSEWYRSGNPAFPVTFTAQTDATCHWIIQYYASHGMSLARRAASEQGTSSAVPLPPGPPPTADDVDELLKRMASPAEANQNLKTPTNQTISIVSKHVPEPDVLFSERGKPKPGKKRTT